MSREDIRNTVVLVFLSVIRELSLTECTDRLAMYLRQATEREVFRQLGVGMREQERHAAAVENGILQKAYERVLSTVPADDRVEQDQIRIRLAEALEDRGLTEDFRFWLTSVIDGQSPLACIETMFPALSPEEQHRLYQQLKRKRSRLVAFVRGWLSAELDVGNIKFRSPARLQKRFFPDEGKSSPKREAGGETARSTTRQRSDRNE